MPQPDVKLSEFIIRSKSRALGTYCSMKDVISLWASLGIILSATFIYLAGHALRLAHSQERSFLATLATCLILTTAVACTLLPVVDIALVASTNIPLLGVRKEAATNQKVDAIVLWIKIGYITIYAIQSTLILVLAPFSWIYFEEWDEEASIGSRAATATKYTAFLVVILALLFGIGLIIPSKGNLPEKPITGIDFEYLKHLLESSRPTKSLLFVLAIFLCIGTLITIYYTSTGMSALPISLLKSKNVKDLDDEEGDAAVNLDLNRQEQRQIELRYEGTRNAMSARDKKVLESLQRRERLLIRSQRLKQEGRSRIMERLSQPIHILMGLLSLFVSLILVITLIISLVRSLLSGDACGPRCSFLRVLPTSILLNPLDLILSDSPYYASFVLHCVLSLFFIAASLYGLQSLGIRFLWYSLFKIRHKAAVPQALLSYAVFTFLATIGIQYMMATFIVPEYVQYGGQTFCNATLSECAEDSSLVKKCTLLTFETDTGCTRSVVSRIGAALLANFPTFGYILFWAQFAFVGVFLFALIISVFKKNLGRWSLSEEDDEDEEVEEVHSSNERSRLL